MSVNVTAVVSVIVGSVRASPQRRREGSRLADSTWKGTGGASVLPGSAAEGAGVLAGDILIAVGGAEVADLRGYSNLLKRHAPGDEVELELRRGEEIVTLRAVLRAR